MESRPPGARRSHARSPPSIAAQAQRIAAGDCYQALQQDRGAQGLCVNYYKRHLGDYAEGWHRFDALRPSRMPPLPACYAIYWNGELVYVGQSVDLRNRFHLHRFRHGYGNNIHTPWGEAAGTDVFIVKAKFCGPYGSWAMREVRLIAKLRPKFNVHHKGRKAA